MLKKTKGADTTPEGRPRKSRLERAEGTLESTGLLTQFLTTEELVQLSKASTTTRQMTADARKKQALEKLLSAVVCGNEALARKIVTSRPELLLDSSAIVTDLSGKEIKGLTPLHAAICAGDVDMVQMMQEVLQQKLQSGVQLGFEPEVEMQRQFTAIYPDAIDSAAAAQQATGESFKASDLRVIFDAINAAQDEEVQAELINPGQELPGSALNKALRDFRAQFTDLSNQEQIFNPFYLLKAFELYAEQFDDYNGNANSGDQWNRRMLFWRQIIGYMQRHLPACYLQAFAQGIYYIANGGEKLKRDFEFRHDKGFYMRPALGDLNNLGYRWAPAAGRAGRWRVAAYAVAPRPLRPAGLAFKNYCEQKNQVWRTYMPCAAVEAARLRNSVRYSCCNIC